jgi:hypothetical protein
VEEATRSTGDTQ